MTIDQAVDLIREALGLALVMSLPILGSALVIGLTVSLFQAVTQIQEQTLSFVPKIIGMGVAAIIVIPWIGMRIAEFATRMFSGV